MAERMHMIRLDSIRIICKRKKASNREKNIKKIYQRKAAHILHSPLRPANMAHSFNKGVTNVIIYNIIV